MGFLCLFPQILLNLFILNFILAGEGPVPETYAEPEFSMHNAVCTHAHFVIWDTGRLIFLCVELGKAWTGKMDLENHGGDFLRGREGIFLSWKLCSLTALLIFTLDHCSAGLCSTSLKWDFPFANLCWLREEEEDEGGKAALASLSGEDQLGKPPVGAYHEMVDVRHVKSHGHLHWQLRTVPL